MRIFIVGPMASGKSTLGKKLASKLNIDFLDTDREIEKKAGADVSWIFEMEGEKGFRKREKSTLQESVKKDNIVIATGGGIITTNDKAIAERVKLMRMHGIDRNVWGRFTSEMSSWEYDVKAPGFKYNMPDINAAIGLAQLERVEMMRNVRQKIAEYYIRELSEVAEVDIPTNHVPYRDHAWHLFPLVLNEKATIGRNQIIDKLATDGIGTSVHYKPLHRMSYYRDKYNLKQESFPNTEKIWRGNFSLPIYSLMSKDDAKYVVDRIKYHLRVS